MASIVYNDKVVNFNRIVAYGCSFTNGAELADHIILGISPEEMDHLKDIKSRDEVSQIFKDRNFSVGLIEKAQHTLSWACKMAEKFKVDYENRAKAGASNQGILFNVQKDLASGKILDTDLILVGLTSEYRWLYFNDLGNPINVLFGWEHNWPNEDIHREFSLIANGFFLLYQYYNTLVQFNSLHKELNNRLLIQYLHATFTDYVNFHRPQVSTNQEFLRLIEQHSNLESVIDHDYCFGRVVHWDNDTHGYYHPKEKFHQILADHLYGKLIEK